MNIHDRVRENKRARIDQARHEALWERLDTLVMDERAARNYPTDVRVVK